MVRQDAAVGGRKLESLAVATEQLNGRVIELGIQRIAGRLYSHLRELPRTAGVQDNQAVIEPAPRHVDLATRMAASREGVSRELARLRHLGLLTLARVRWVSNFSAYREATASSACTPKEASASMAETDRKREMVFRMKSFSSMRFEAPLSRTDAGSDFLEAARHSCAEKIFLFGARTGRCDFSPAISFRCSRKGRFLWRHGGRCRGPHAPLGGRFARG